MYLKVNIERDIDIGRLLINLNQKSQCSSIGMSGYEVTVNKQLLRDAHDVIKQFMKLEKYKDRYKIGDKFYIDDCWYITEKWCGEAHGIFVIYKIDDTNIRGNGTEYYLYYENDKDIKILVTEDILDRNEFLKEK